MTSAVRTCLLEKLPALACLGLHVKATKEKNEYVW